jgi:hypothetical protein
MKMQKKKKTHYWKERVNNLAHSFTEPRIAGWLWSVATDLVFFFASVVLLIVFLSTMIHHFEGVNQTAKDTYSIMPSIQGGIMSPDISQKMSEIKANIDGFFLDLLYVALFYLALFCVLVGSWNFIAFSRILKIKRTLSSWLKFILVFACWSFAFAVLFAVVLIFTHKVLAVLLMLLLLVLYLYLAPVLFCVCFKRKFLSTIKDTFIIGFKNVHKIGFAFLLLLVVLAGLNLVLLVLKPGLTPLPILLSFLIFILFISWSRFYICTEIREAVEHE